MNISEKLVVEIQDLDELNRVTMLVEYEATISACEWILKEVQ